MIRQPAAKRPQVLFKQLALKENFLQEINGPLGMTGKTAKTMEGASRDILLGCWSIFHAAEEYKAAVSTQLTLSSVLSEAG